MTVKTKLQKGESTLIVHKKNQKMKQAHFEERLSQEQHCVQSQNYLFFLTNAYQRSPGHRVRGRTTPWRSHWSITACAHTHIYIRIQTH